MSGKSSMMCYVAGSSFKSAWCSNRERRIKFTFGKAVNVDILACLIDRIWSTELKKCQLICNMYAWISHNSNVKNDVSVGNIIPRILIVVENCYLQLFVPYIFFGCIFIFVETRIIFL